jgi:hypothetical protein
MSLARKALAVATCLATAGCAVELGPTYDSMRLVAQRYCPGPEPILPKAIDRDVRGLLLSGDGIDDLWPWPLNWPAYDFLEWEPQTPPPDGTRYLRFVRTAAAKRLGYDEGCPVGAQSISMAPESDAVFGDSARACVRIQPIAEPSARWHVHHTRADHTDGPFDVRTTWDEIVDRRDGQSVMRHRSLRIVSRSATRELAFIGPVPFYLGKSHAHGWCGPVLNAESLKQILIPPSFKPATGSQ